MADASTRKTRGAGDGQETLELRIDGMTCQDCADEVAEALQRLPGVDDVRVLVGAERATVTYDPVRIAPAQLAAAVVDAGYTVPAPTAPTAPVRVADMSGVSEGAAGAACDDACCAVSAPRALAASTAGNAVEPAAAPGPVANEANVGQVIGWGVLGMVAAVVILAALGERLGLLDAAVGRLPWWIPAGAIVIGGWPLFRGVVRSALRRRITTESLMTLGVVAAAAVGEWTTAALIVFFMRFAEWMEELTTERARQAIKQLVRLAPQTARVVRDGQETELPVEAVYAGDVVLVYPGERVPVDGEVLEGQAPVDEASITGESVPVDKTPGDRVFAATIAQAGFLRVRGTRVGADTTFGRIVRLVEEAEAQKAPIQKFADRFAGYYLPVVVTAALLTLVLTHQVLNAVAVVVVACACAIVIATPVVVLASVGAAARRGLLIKGGIALEQLARVDTVVLDKTGTLTFGRPRLTDVVPLSGLLEGELLRAVATAERRSEHPLARAIVAAAGERGLPLDEPANFGTFPGRGVAAELDGTLRGRWTVGNRMLLAERGVATAGAEEAAVLERQGKTVFFAARDAELVGLVAVADTVRPDAAAALADLKRLGVSRLLLLTGDNERVAAAIAAPFQPLGLEYRAGLLPEDKIAVIKQLQAEGHRVLMVGDGVNDAPALAQADVGVAMGVAGSDVAIEAADVALLRDDWSMVPEAIRIGRRAARTIRQNLWFTAVYNLVGIGLAAVGLLPPVWAAALQSLPDGAILLNAARLLRFESAGHAGQAGRPGLRRPLAGSAAVVPNGASDRLNQSTAVGAR